MCPESEQFGRFRLVERIAVGGMGEVFLARYTTAAGIERQAVVKRILPHLSKDPKFVRYFLNEGRIASLLSHPNVVQTIELGRTADQYYIAMEHIEGQTLVRYLANAMRQRVHLSIPLVYRMTSQILAALEYIHNLCSLEGKPLDIVHMDIAPHNVMVMPDGQAKLMDFGISRSAALGGAATPSFRGRTAYLAPEQFNNLQLDRRVDLFAAGIMMHEMVLTRPLFRARTDQHTATRILYAPIPKLRDTRPDCPGAFESIILRALDRDREYRYQDAGDILADLERVAQDRGIVPATADIRAELTVLSLAPDQAASRRSGVAFEPQLSTTVD